MQALTDYFVRIESSRLAAAVIGPAAFLFIWQVFPAFAGLGVMVWLATYWAMGVMPVLYTAVIPVIGFGLMGASLTTIIQSFWHPALMVIVGPTVVIVAAVHCGLVTRMANYFAQRIGTSVRAHVIFWLVFATLLSDFAADTVIALALTPIALAMLFRAGYHTTDSIAKDKSAMLLIIAVATGAGLGGILTPMAGGQAAITWAGLNKVLGGEVTAWSYTIRYLIPTTVCLGIIVAIFCFLPVSKKHFTFSHEVENEPWSLREKVVAVLLVLAVCLPYVRPWLPFGLPAIYVGLTCVTLLLWLPGQGMVLPITGLRQFPLNAISVWPIAMCVSNMVGVVGTGKALSGILSAIWAFDPVIAIGLWVASCIALAQVASDTASAGMLIPILADGLPNLGLNPVPFIMMTGFSVDLSFMVPTATGTIGVLYALGGRSHWRLPLYGFICAVLCGLFSWAFWATVIINQWNFWFTLDVIK